MVGKCRVHSGQLDFWHVAGHTILCTHGTSSGVPSFSLYVLRCGQMTRETLRIVVDRFSRQLLVRIMTSQTAGTQVIGIVSGAIEHPIRLKADIIYTRLTWHEHGLFEAGMTGSTKRL